MEKRVFSSILRAGNPAGKGVQGAGFSLHRRGKGGKVRGMDAKNGILPGVDTGRVAAPRRARRGMPAAIAGVAA